MDINILGRTCQVSCDEGQERHLRELGIYLDRKIRNIATAMGSGLTTDEFQIMLVTALTIADELNDASFEIAELKSEIEELRKSAPAANNTAAEATIASYQKSLEAVAHKIESIAEELEKA